jgi:hypothetical protein
VEQLARILDQHYRLLVQPDASACRRRHSSEIAITGQSCPPQSKGKFDVRDHDQRRLASSLHISALLMADRRDTARIPALLRAAGTIV